MFSVELCECKVQKRDLRAIHKFRIVVASREPSREVRMRIKIRAFSIVCNSNLFKIKNGLIFLKYKQKNGLDANIPNYQS